MTFSSAFSFYLFLSRFFALYETVRTFINRDQTSRRVVPCANILQRDADRVRKQFDSESSSRKNNSARLYGILIKRNDSRSCSMKNRRLLDCVDIIGEKLPIALDLCVVLYCREEYLMIQIFRASV